MIVIYFSGTGNSKYVASKFAGKMKAECYSIEEQVDFDYCLSHADVIAVCYPIYGSCVPFIMRKFVDKHINEFREKRLIIFCTQMLFSGDGARAFARLIPGCDNWVIYAEHFYMPNNICNFFLFPIREREFERKTRATDMRLEQVCHHIQNGTIKRRGWNSFSAVLGKIQNIAFPKIEEKGKGSFVADRDCIYCGMCVKHCPMHNLELEGSALMQKNNCTLCYRCVNICPQKAATVYLHAKPHKQYRKLI